MNFHSTSFTKNLSNRKKSVKRLPFIKRHIDRIDAAWREYLAGKRERPPLTCIIIGGIEREKQIIQWRYSS